MKTPVFIGLGSNLGDRKMALTQAVVLLNVRLGKLLAQSPIYESPSWGYTSLAYLNACVLIETDLAPKVILRHLQKIETELGRSPKTKTGYEDRSLDLDLLFYGDQRIAVHELTVPHPQLHLRNFVLQPLAAIASNFVHPQLQLSIQQLLKQCPDTAQLQEVAAAPWAPQLFTASKQRLVIEGNIGSGKTTLTQKIATQFGIPALYENFSDNPHLAPFYKNPTQYALAVESHFMEDRIRAYTNFFKVADIRSGAVADYTYLKSLLFAQINLNASDYQAFKMDFLRQTMVLSPPDVLLYLHRPTAVLLEQIRKRGRPYEQEISPAYLEAIATQYERFLEELSCPVLRIDIGADDFISDVTVYEALLTQLIGL